MTSSTRVYDVIYTRVGMLGHVQPKGCRLDVFDREWGVIVHWWMVCGFKFRFFPTRVGNRGAVSITFQGNNLHCFDLMMVGC